MKAVKEGGDSGARRGGLLLVDSVTPMHHSPTYQ